MAELAAHLADGVLGPQRHRRLRDLSWIIAVPDLRQCAAAVRALERAHPD
jgi:hypothetical protein